MIIKDEFNLLKGVKNIVDVPGKKLDEYIKDENKPKRVHAYLKLSKSKLNHFSVDQIFKKLEDDDFLQKIKIVDFERYVLPVTCGKKGDSIIINLRSFDVDEISKLDPKTLYASILYGTVLHSLVIDNKDVKSNYYSIFSSYMSSMLVRLFGKQFGLLGMYTDKIPLLKFLLTSYILESFFGTTGNRNYKLASSFSNYDYREIKDSLEKYDFSYTDNFISALSDFKVMPGLNKYRFTERILKTLTINFLPAFEDCSRFISTIMASSVGGNTLIPHFIFRYNENEYKKILDLSKYILR